MTQTMSNPKFTPTPEQAALDAEVEARRQRMLQEGKEPPPKIGEERPTPTAAEFIQEVYSRFGKTPPLPGDLEQQERERRERDAREIQEREKDYRRRAFEKVCPERFREKWDWKKASADVQSAEKKALVKRAMAWRPGADGLGLYIVGPSGHGKSRLLYRMLEQLMVQEGRKALVMDGTRFSNLLTRAFGTPDETERMLDPLCRCPLLAIDDFGKRWTPATEEGAFTIIDRRTAAKLPVLLTLNYTAEDLLKMQNARGALAEARDIVTPLVRRLADYCEVIVL